MSSIYERALYPSQRSVKWLHQTLSTLKWNIIVKGYTPDEAEEMVWDLLEEADLRRTENVLETLVKRTSEILPKQEAELLSIESMLKAMHTEVCGFCKAHYYVSFLTRDERKVAEALVKAGVNPENVDAGFELEQDNHILVNFDGCVDRDLILLISAYLPDVLINAEDCWDNIVSYVVLNGRLAEWGRDYKAGYRCWKTDEAEGYWDTEFSVYTMDGKLFVGGGCGCVAASNLPNYLGPYGYSCSFDGDPLDDNEESFMDFELSNGFATREDYGLPAVGGA